jgi:hypothetical protein
MLPRFQNCETLVVMEPELVRIGGFEISKVVFETAALLTSGIIGGLISYLTTWAADKRKWRQSGLKEECKIAAPRVAGARHSSFCRPWVGRELVICWEYPLPLNLLIV